MTLNPGLYEGLVTEALLGQLEPLPERLVAASRDLGASEAADRIALHISREVERALSDVHDDHRVEVGIRVAQALVDTLCALVDTDGAAKPLEPGRVLHAITERRPDGKPAEITEPLTPLLDTTLLTNAPGEPNLWSQIGSEIGSADRIDLVMAFIRRSGIAPLLRALRRHVEAGKPLRVLTTTYTGSTERQALDQLADLGADIRISYDLGTTRLHAKAWIFHRDSGFSTAYVGSSNLTQSAQVTGLEWNVRVSGARNPDVLGKFAAVFDGYWEGGDFVPYKRAEFDAEQQRAVPRDEGPQVILSPIELRPHPFQERMLELIEVSRRQDHHRNLVVAATGTGKTVVAAVDYARLRQRLPRARLLFVAHREEILNQSLATFRYALRDASFGEKWVGGARPREWDYVFASIQSLNAGDLETLPPDHFDVVIVDEFHHAAARSYQRALDYLRPRELIGLTATPERADGLPILQWFDDRIAVELRLWDAIDQQFLAPFMYFGIHDDVDLREVPWKRGYGYDVAALSAVYTSSDAWARLVVQQLRERVDPLRMRCLGFCVSVAHARFMAARFSSHGVPSVAIWGETPRDEREAALRNLRDGRINALFTVDLFNEGVDIPAVDTVLMLRPTESATLFLQQLGRGLRRADGKAFCTVLDFVGTHRREFRFDRKLRALLGGTRREVEKAVERSFPFLPSGCHMELDAKASEIILRSLRSAIPSQWRARVDELRSLRQASPDIDLRQFLDESGLDLEDIYDNNRSWSELLEAAGAPTRPAGSHEVSLRRAIGRLLHIDDEERLKAYQRLLAAEHTPRVTDLPERERRLLRMLLTSVTESAITKESSLQDAAFALWSHPQVRSELVELMGVLATEVSHLHAPLDRSRHPDVPLQVHARYTRVEILAAIGMADRARVRPWREGVYEAKEARAEVFAFTLDKSKGGFSPTTRYRDYAISRSLIHWESQSVTRADSATGLRYRNHEQENRSILLFARMRTDDRAFWFLGPARYRGHVGERPMAITWELEHLLPGDLYASFAAAVA